MNKADYEKALRAAKTESVELIKKRNEIDARLSQLKSTIDSLRVLVGEQEPRVVRLVERIDTFRADDPGITAAIRLILANSHEVPMTSAEIKLALKSRGFDLSEYVNPSAVIHNTLSRLVRQGEVTAFGPSSGKITGYALTTGQKASRQAAPAGGVPNPHGKTLGEMLKET